jgi:hypothetical protein
MVIASVVHWVANYPCTTDAQRGRRLEVLMGLVSAVMSPQAEDPLLEESVGSDADPPLDRFHGARETLKGDRRDPPKSERVRGAATIANASPRACAVRRTSCSEEERERSGR